MRITTSNITAIGDNCPACLTPTGPVVATVTGDQVSSLYRCGCGHTWTTNRLVGAYDDFDHATDYTTTGDTQ